MLTLEYKVLNYSQKIKLKGMTYDEANSNNLKLCIDFTIGKIIISKVRLYYFFS